jgi:putative nucleotidyltransferase with HDIG domain
LGETQELVLEGLITFTALARPTIRLGLYTVALAIAVLITAAALVNAELSRPSWAVLALAALAAVAERSRVRLSSTLELSISLLPILFAAVVFGPLAAMCVGAASLLSDIPLGSKAASYDQAWLRWTIYSLSESLTGAATGGAAALALRAGGNSTLGPIVLATVVGAIVSQTLDVTFSTLTVWLRGRGRVRDILPTVAPVVSASVPLYAPVVALLAFSYEVVSPWTLPLFLVPAVAAHRLFTLYQEQIRLTENLVVANVRLENANLSFATALVATLDARDRYTAGHSAAVAIYARDIARRMGLDEEQQQLAHLCGLVHDIGKVGLPPGLLEKSGALSLEERRQMEQHAAIGERILSKVDDYAEISRVVRHHHERVDGLGYPDGLREDEIPVLSRIIAVADAYNAMTSDRPYREAMPSRVARLRLAQAVESQFDTAVVAAFEAILTAANEEYRAGSRDDFRLQEQEAEATAIRHAQAI